MTRDIMTVNCWSEIAVINTEHCFPPFSPDSEERDEEKTDMMERESQEDAKGENRNRSVLNQVRSQEMGTICVFLEMKTWS